MKAEIGLRDPQILSLWENILKDHLAVSTKAISKKDGWKYKQRLSRSFDFLPSFWNSLPETIRMVKAGRYQLFSIDEINTLRTITTHYSKSSQTTIKPLKNSSFILRSDDFKVLSNKSVSSIFANREPVEVKKINEGEYAISWQICERQVYEDDIVKGRDDKPFTLLVCQFGILESSYIK